ncbi:hypothetical protein Hoch_0936 [Haliangium ochraceum DSM 14365]|uniref:Uncharacterized protein n=1 Tax=Haliangium ochraceum (strain DSM 14365 / JCM 11303 / SMP-2) TaxID=502025 RepID=D0LPH8_HALO1|nr:hypothetical protein Hoch_0936 [Haliangium ochraceum DSM 14365]
MKGENTGADAEGQANATGGGEAVPEATGQSTNPQAQADAGADAVHIEATSVRTENGAIVVTGRLFRHGGSNGRPHRFSGEPGKQPPRPTRDVAAAHRHRQRPASRGSSRHDPHGGRLA